MTKTRSWGARAAAVAAAVGLLVGAAGVVNAQPADGVDVAFNIAPGGTLNIDGLADTAIPVPDPNPAQVSGSWSPTTGEFAGNLTGAVIPVSIDDPLPLTIDASLTASGVTGTIPPDGTAGSVTVAGLTLNLSIALLSVNCSLPVGDADLTATLVPGEPVGLTLTGDLVVPVSPLPAGCELLAKLLPVGADTLDVALSLSLAQVGAEPEPEPEPEPEAAPATPAFTG